MLLEKRYLLQDLVVKECVKKFLVILSNTSVYIREHMC